jgi:hypothetical protein
MKKQFFAFDQLVDFATRPARAVKPITKKKFNQWQQDFIFDALQGQRYGQSFCNTFGIDDNLLFYNSWSVDRTNEYLEKNYIERSRV